MREVAKWSAAKGKRFLTLTCDAMGYAYKTDNGGGYLGRFANDELAIHRVLNPWGKETGPVTVIRSDFLSIKRVK